MTKLLLKNQIINLRSLIKTCKRKIKQSQTFKWKTKKNLTLNNLQLGNIKVNSINPIDNYISNSTSAEGKYIKIIKITKYMLLNDSLY